MLRSLVGSEMSIRERTSLASNSKISTCLCFLSAEINGVHHHHPAQFEFLKITELGSVKKAQRLIDVVFPSVCYEYIFF